LTVKEFLMAAMGMSASLVPLMCLQLAQSSVSQQLAQLPSAEQSSAVSERLLLESRAPAAATVKVWLEGDRSSREKARAVLSDLEEAALDPLLKVQRPLTPEDQVWRLTMVVETVSNLRQSTVRVLAKQLSNTQPVPVPTSEVTEEREPPRRVCDEAYMLMSRLLAPNPQSVDFVLRMREFVRLPVTRRDAEIRRVRQSSASRGVSPDSSLANPD
jgi:hypothetical protein